MNVGQVGQVFLRQTEVIPPALEFLAKSSLGASHEMDRGQTGTIVPETIVSFYGRIHLLIVMPRPTVRLGAPTLGNLVERRKRWNHSRIAELIGRGNQY